MPFYDDPAWTRDAPALTGALLALDDRQLAHFDNAPESLQAWISTQLPTLRDVFIAADNCLDHAPLRPPLAIAEAQGRDVPGRKWQQLLHFAAACSVGTIPNADAQVVAAHVVEWCSGKAHLGRLLASTSGLPVQAIEWNAALCAEGNRLAARDRVDIRFLRADVLTVSAADAKLDARAHAVALHACGDLHVALLHKAAAAQVHAIDIAPCCFHLTQEPVWRPQSSALATSTLATLPLTRADLRLAVQETATSSARVIRQQRELAAWRLGFDALQRDLRGTDTYLPTPPRPARVLADGFAAFCRDLATHHQMTLPAALDYDSYLQRGLHRHQRVRRLDLLRHACRRPLEILLVADRALALADAGYHVSLRPFCARALTPRNLLIQARRQPDSSSHSSDGTAVITGTIVPFQPEPGGQQ